MSDPWAAQRDALGAYIRSQRKLANLSLRQLAELTSLSNPYLSQIERGLHQPSVRVLKLLSGLSTFPRKHCSLKPGCWIRTVPQAPPGRRPWFRTVSAGGGGRHPRRSAAGR